MAKKSKFSGRKLTPDERESIKQAAYSKAESKWQMTKRWAKVIGENYTVATKKLSGSAPLCQSEARMLYKVLGEDPSVGFLKRYVATPESPERSTESSSVATEAIDEKIPTLFDAWEKLGSPKDYGVEERLTMDRLFNVIYATIMGQASAHYKLLNREQKVQFLGELEDRVKDLIQASKLRYFGIRQ